MNTSFIDLIYSRHENPPKDIKEISLSDAQAQKTSDRKKVLAKGGNHPKSALWVSETAAETAELRRRRDEKEDKLRAEQGLPKLDRSQQLI